MTTDSPVIVVSYPSRHRAVAIAEQIRSNKIGAAVIASAHRAGTWDVMVRPSDAERVSATVKSL
jgi:hypothetical protein